jgi:hypothetical protein
METAGEGDLLTKVRMVAQGPYGDLLKKFVDLLYNRQEAYDTEPLSPECLQALEEVEEAVKQGDMSRFTPWEEVKKELGL